MKRREYFLAGTRLVWMVDPVKRIVEVYTSPDDFITLVEDETLDGSDVLPGFKLPLRKLFGAVPAAKKKPRRRKR